MFFADGIFTDAFVGNADMFENSNFYRCILNNSHFTLADSDIFL